MSGREDEILEGIRDAGERVTVARRAVVAALVAADGHATAEALQARVQAEHPEVHMATIYRNLQALSDAGTVDVLRNSDGEAIYRLCATDAHHHHLVCRSCGTSIEIASDEVERWADRTARAHGFTAVTHTAELYGVCATCSS